MSQIFPLPDVGEGLTEAEILSWKVAVGTEVAINDVLVEIETAKSVVELPSPFAGTVEALLVAEGETVEVGTPIISISGGDNAPATPAAPAAAEPESGTALVGSNPARTGCCGTGRTGCSGTRGAHPRRLGEPQPGPAERAG